MKETHPIPPEVEAPPLVEIDKYHRKYDVPFCDTEPPIEAYEKTSPIDFKVIPFILESICFLTCLVLSLFVVTGVVSVVCMFIALALFCCMMSRMYEI